MFWVAEKRDEAFQAAELFSVLEYVEQVTKITIKRQQFWRDIKDNAALSALESLIKSGVSGAISAAYLAPNIYFQDPDDDEGANFLAEKGNDSVKTLVQAIAQDADVLSELGKLKAMPLWPHLGPDWFEETDRETRAIWAKDPATWAFWERWWDGVISGDMPFPPDLLRDVALIEDDIWQAGPREVAAAIAKIEKIHELRADLAALTQAMENEDLPQVQRGATLSHRGHNNPPEMIEAIAIVQANAVDITQALDDARERFWRSPRQSQAD